MSLLLRILLVTLAMVLVGLGVLELLNPAYIPEASYLVSMQFDRKALAILCMVAGAALIGFLIVLQTRRQGKQIPQ